MCTVQCLHISNWTKQILITFRFFFFLHVLCIQILSGRECVCHIFNDLNTPQKVTHMLATNVRSCESWLALALPLALTSNAIRFYFSSFNDVFVVDINVFGKRRQSLCFVSHRSNACICANIAIPFHVQPAHVSQQQATREMRWKNFYFILYFFVCFFFSRCCFISYGARTHRLQTVRNTSENSCTPPSSSRFVCVCECLSELCSCARMGHSMVS